MSPSPPSPPSPYIAILNFVASHAAVPFEVSFVPPPDIQTSGPHIGIPKASLVAAFTHAHHLFFRAAPAESATPSKALLDAAMILILTASEHQTAVNMRRRALRASLLSPEAELNWLQSLLTSPLPKQNKSPLLWSYRRWVLTEFPALKPTALAEMAVVQKSAEAHPRNYYAWDHARWAFLALESADESVLNAHLHFCWTHPADCGVWSFLEILMGRCGDEVRKERLVVEIMQFSEVAPGHESLWGFVRTVIGRGRDVLEKGARVRLRGVLEGYVAQGKRPRALQREWELQVRSLKWVDRFGDLRECNEVES